METAIPDSRERKDSKYCYQPTRHIITEDLKIITDSKNRSKNSRFNAILSFLSNKSINIWLQYQSNTLLM